MFRVPATTSRIEPSKSSPHFDTATSAPAPAPAPPSSSSSRGSALSPKVSNQFDTDKIEDRESLLKFIQSEEFTLYNNIECLIKYSNNIGIHFYLCEKLLSFPHFSLQFYIPQFVQILLTVETESLALEEALMTLSNENPHFALLTFWQLQALLGDLSNDPKSYGFEVARRNLNKLQNLLLDFSLGNTEIDVEPSKKIDVVSLNKLEKMRENIHPSIVSTSMVWAAIGMPQSGELVKPLVVSQGKREKSYVFTVAKKALKKFNKNLGSLTSKGKHDDSVKKPAESAHKSHDTSHIHSHKTIKKRNTIDNSKVIFSSTTTKEDIEFKKVRELSPTRKEIQRQKSFDIVDKIGSDLFNQTISSSTKFPRRRIQRNALVSSASFPASPVSPTCLSNEDSTGLNLSLIPNDTQLSKDKSWLHNVHKDKSNIFMNSMPALENDLSNTNSNIQNTQDDSASVSSLDNNMLESTSKHAKPDLAVVTKTTNHENIPVDTPTFDPFIQHQERRSSLRHGANLIDIEPSKLSTTKKIRLLKMNYFRCETQFVIALESISLRLSRVPKDARLTMLRAELALLNRDLPAEVDIPTLLPSNKRGKLHKLVNIVCNEAQVLNSAEKVPYLLFIEYLRDDMDFDPTTDSNEDLLQERPQDGNFIFDLTNIKNKDYENQLLKKDSSTFNTLSSSLEQPFSKREVDLGDMSMIKVDKETTAESYRRKISTSWAEKAPMVTSSGNVIDSNESSDLSNIASSNNENGKHTNSVSSLDDLATQMRISAMMLAQLDSSLQTNVKLKESTDEIRDTIIKSMQEVQDKFGFKPTDVMENNAGDRKLENDLLTGGLLMPKMDTSYLGEDWNTKRERIKKTSEFGHLDNWDLCSVIAKSGDDLRQEAFACQLIQAIASIWQADNLDIWVKKMRILITSPTTGLVETITNAVSIHSIKKSLTTKMVENGELNNNKGEIATLLDHFRYAYGDSSSYKYKRAQDNFACSLAAYSLICYFLQIKDRHNGNIMIDNEGHVVHIDFGFMFSNSPGSVKFEAAPFKLTFEYIDVLGGLEGEPFLKFCDLVKKGFKAMRKNSEQLVSMCKIMQKESLQPCFGAGEQTSIQFEQRFALWLSEEDCDKYVEDYLINKSIGSMYTRLYDQFQLLTQGIYS